MTSAAIRQSKAETSKEVIGVDAAFAVEDVFPKDIGAVCPREDTTPKPGDRPLCGLSSCCAIKRGSLASDALPWQWPDATTSSGCPQCI